MESLTIADIMVHIIKVTNQWFMINLCLVKQRDSVTGVEVWLDGKNFPQPFQM